MNWWFTLFKVRGVSFRAHWSAPLMLVLVAQNQPPLYLILLSAVLIHEFGHALMASHFGAHVTSIDVHAFGGFCRYLGYPTPLASALIAGAGVTAQALLVAGALATGAILHPAPGTTGDRLLIGVVTVNFGMILLNLLPMRPFDGLEAWKIVPLGARWIGTRVRYASAITKARWKARHLRVIRDDDDDAGKPPGSGPPTVH